MSIGANDKKHKAVDFFCGGGGMTCGLRQAGIDVIAGVDFDEKNPTAITRTPSTGIWMRSILEALKEFLEKSLKEEIFME